MDELAATPISRYGPPVVEIDCARCKRHASVETHRLQVEHGSETTLGEAARRVAASRGCALAAAGPSESICGVRVVAPPIWHWASLDEARRLGYLAQLRCARHMVALKRARPCAGVVDLDIETLVAALGPYFKLEHLQPRLVCPTCGTRSVEVRWVPPPDTPPPGAPAATVLQLKPTRAALGRKSLRVVEGGRRKGAHSATADELGPAGGRGPKPRKP